MGSDQKLMTWRTGSWKDWSHRIGPFQAEFGGRDPAWLTSDCVLSPEVMTGYDLLYISRDARAKVSFLK